LTTGFQADASDNQFAAIVVKLLNLDIHIFRQSNLDEDGLFIRAGLPN